MVDLAIGYRYNQCKENYLKQGSNPFSDLQSSFPHRRSSHNANAAAMNIDIAMNVEPNAITAAISVATKPGTSGQNPIPFASSRAVETRGDTVLACAIPVITDLREQELLKEGSGSTGALPRADTSYSMGKKIIRSPRAVVSYTNTERFCMTQLAPGHTDATGAELRSGG